VRDELLGKISFTLGRHHDYQRHALGGAVS
jgi:hypothetical protein